MAEITYRNFEKLGAPDWSEEAKDFAREHPALARPRADGGAVLRGPDAPDTAAGGRRGLPRASSPPGSSTTPRTTMSTTPGTRRPSASMSARPTLRRAESRISLSRMDAPCDGRRAGLHRSDVDQGLRRHRDDPPRSFDATRPRCSARRRNSASAPAAASAARAGSRRLLPPDFEAPIGYRWPEYVSTPRGEEWSVA